MRNFQSIWRKESKSVQNQMPYKQYISIASLSRSLTYLSNHLIRRIPFIFHRFDGSKAPNISAANKYTPTQPGTTSVLFVRPTFSRQTTQQRGVWNFQTLSGGSRNFKGCYLLINTRRLNWVMIFMAENQ